MSMLNNLTCSLFNDISNESCMACGDSNWLLPSTNESRAVSSSGGSSSLSSRSLAALSKKASQMDDSFDEDGTNKD